MPALRRTIRLFVSSTFSDMKSERDVLQDDVFPKLRQLCRSNGLHFQPIDLRWGVPEEAGKYNHTMRICLRELKRCQEARPKPNFLILLGDRYGWQPLPEIIPADLFAQLRDHLIAAMQELFEWRDTQPANAKGWYRRNDNVVPPVYELRPRGDEERWHETVAQPLLHALEAAARQVGLDTERNSVAIGSSATEQEIVEGALKVDDARDHVHAFFRSIRGLPRNPWPQEFVDVSNDGRRDSSATARLEDLKSRIKAKVGRTNVHRYTVPWKKGGITTADLVQFGKDVYAALRDVVLRQIDQLTKTSGDVQEEQAHRSFGDERCLGFIGRTEPLERIAVCLRGSDHGVVAVVGPSGSGKSAVMAEAVRRARQTHGEDAVLARFIGATPDSANLLLLLGNLVMEIRRRYPAPFREGEIPVEINPLTVAFHEALARPKDGRPLFIFLDALDQLMPSHGAWEGHWLPGGLNPHVRLILSVTLPGATDAIPSDGAVTSPVPSLATVDLRATLMATLERRASQVEQIRLQPLSVDDGRTLVAQWLEGAGRTLQPVQEQAILASFEQEGNPLWLRVAVAESQQLASWDAEPAFAPALPAVMRQVLEGLSAKEEHGPVLVERALAGIASARHGLAEDEVMDVLSGDKEVMEDFYSRSPTELRKPEAERVKALPVAVWVRLHADIAPYLADRQFQNATLLSFYQRSFLEAAQTTYLGTVEKQRAAHQRLADYFGAHSWFIAPVDEQGSARFRSQFGPPAATKAITARLALLVYRMLRYGMKYVDQAAEKAGGDAEGTGKKVYEFCQKQMAECDQQLAPYLGRLEGWRRKAALPERAAAIIDPPDTRKASELPWHLMRVADAVDPSHSQPVAWDAPVDVLCNLEFVEAKCRAGLAFELQEDYRLALSMLPEAQLNLQEEQRRQERAVQWTNEIVAYASHWNERQKKLMRNESMSAPEPPLPELIAAAEPWTDEALESDCRRIARSPARLDRLRVFARLIETELYRVSRFAWQPGFVVQQAMSAFPPGQFRSEVSRLAALFGTPFLRRANQGTASLGRPALLLTLAGHTGQVMSVFITPDGRRAVSGGWDNTLRIWDLQSGQCVHTLTVTDSNLEALSVTPDGRIAVLGQGQAVSVWDLEAGVCLRTRQAHSGSVTAVSVTPDGRRVVSGGKDKMVRVWNLETGECLHELLGHTARVNSVAASFDGRRAASGGNDRVMLAWDLWAGSSIGVKGEHQGRITNVQIGSGGQYVISTGGDGTLRIWDLANGSPPTVLPIYKLAKHSASSAGAKMVTEIATDVGVPFLQSRQFLEHYTDLLEAFAHRDGEPQPEKDLEGEAPQFVELPVHARATSDGRYLLTVRGAELRYWDLATGTCRRILTEHGAQVNAIDLTPDGRRAVSASSDGTVRLWNLESGIQTAGRTMDSNFGEYADFVCARPGIRYLVYWNLEQMSPNLQGYSGIKIWDTKTARCVHILDSHLGPTTSVSLTPDGKFAVSSGPWDPYLKIWDLEMGTSVRRIKVASKEGSGVVTARVTPDGKNLICWCNEDERLHVLDFATGKCIRVLDTARFDQICCLPEGKKVLVALGLELRILDLRNGDCLKEMYGHLGWVNALCLAPDGRRAISAGEDKAIGVWDVQTGCCLHLLEGHTDKISAVTVTPDGKWIVSASHDDTVRVWDIETGKCVAIHSEPYAGVLTAALIGDGSTVFVGSRSMTIFMLKLVEEPLRDGLAADPFEESVEAARAESTRASAYPSIGTGAGIGGAQERESPVRPGIVVLRAGAAHPEPTLTLTRISGKDLLSVVEQENKCRSAYEQIEEALEHSRNGHFREALAACDAAASLAPEEPAIHFVRGYAHAGLGDFQKAIEDSQKYSRMLPPDCPEEMRDNAAMLEQQIKEASELLQECGAQAFQLCMEGSIDVSAGQFAVAESKLREALRVCPSAGKPRVESLLSGLLANWAVDDVNKAGNTLDSATLQSAQNRLDEALRLNPSAELVRKNLEHLRERANEIYREPAYKQLEKAWEHYNRDEFREAVAACTTAELLLPCNPSLYYLRAQALFGLGDFEQGLADAQKFLRLVPEDAPPEMHAAAAKLKPVIQKATAEIEKVGPQVFRLRREGVEAYNAGQYPLAESKLREAICLCPVPSRHELECELSALLTNWVRHDLNETVGKVDSATLAALERRLDEAVRLDPSNNVARSRLKEIWCEHLNQGLEDLLRGRISEVIALCDALEPLLPDVPELYLLCAEARLKTGDFEKAREAAQTFLQMLPENADEQRHPAAVQMELLVRLGGQAFSLWRQDQFELAEGFAGGQQQPEPDELERQLGPEHPEVLRAWNNRSADLRKQGLPEQSEPIVRRVLAATVKVRGPVHPLTIHRRNNLALTLILLGRLAEARELLQQNWCSGGERFANTTPCVGFLAYVITRLEASPGSVFLGQLKRLLTGPELPITAEVAMPWDVAYFIEQLRSRLPSGCPDFLTSLLAAVNEPSKFADLDQFAEWRDQPAIPLDTPWPDWDPNTHAD